VCIERPQNPYQNIVRQVKLIERECVVCVYVCVCRCCMYFWAISPSVLIVGRRVLHLPVCGPGGGADVEADPAGDLAGVAVAESGGQSRRHLMTREMPHNNHHNNTLCPFALLFAVFPPTRSDIKPQTT
jgi:hypothetical protein